MAGEERDPAVLEFLREKYRLNDPIPVQYFVWLGEVLRGNLGISLRTDIPVLELVLSKLPVTIELAILAMIVALLIGIPAGIISAVKKGTTVDYAANVVALSGLSIPNFWLGIMLIMLVSVRWQLLPASGYVPPTEDLWLNIKTMIMPAIRARHRARRQPDAPHPQRDAGRPALRLYPHGHAPRACCPAPSSSSTRCATR